MARSPIQKRLTAEQVLEAERRITELLKERGVETLGGQTIVGLDKPLSHELAKQRGNTIRQGQRDVERFDAEGWLGEDNGRKWTLLGTPGAPSSLDGRYAVRKTEIAKVRSDAGGSPPKSGSRLRGAQPGEPRSRDPRPDRRK